MASREPCDAHRFSANRAASKRTASWKRGVLLHGIGVRLGTPRRASSQPISLFIFPLRRRIGGGGPPPMDHSEQSGHAAAAHAMALIERHQPWEMLDGMALSIIDETYAAAVGIVGRGELKGKDYYGGVVEIRDAVRAADPDSPVLTVHASRSHCFVALNSPRGDNPPYRRYTSPKQKSRPRHRLARASVSVSPGTLYLSRTDDAFPTPKDYDSCHHDATAGGVLAILDMIVARLGAAIRLEEALLVRARASSCEGPKVDEILRVRNALDEIRSEMDLPALMRRLLQKRRGVTEITTCRPAAGAAAMEQDQAEETERLMKKMRLKC